MKTNHSYSIIETAKTTIENPSQSSRTSALRCPFRHLPLAAFSWLCVLLAFPGTMRAQSVLTGTGLTPYVMHDPDPTQVDKEPPKGGGNGWDPVGPDGITLQPHEIVALAVRNVYNADRTKTCKVMLGKKGDGRGKFLKDNIGKSSPAGWDSDGARTGAILKSSSEAYIPRDTVFIEFEPQPAWERINLENKTDAPITFPVEVETKCVKHQVQSRTYKSNCSFGAAGAMLTNQYTTEVVLFPRTVALDPSAPLIFSAPTNSGNWSAIPVYNDPDGTNRPLGGVLYWTDGPGLSPGDECQFSFTMQGPAADLQYSMYAYDFVSGEFQDYPIDLRPTLAISTSNNAVGLRFDSVLGLNYILDNSTDLQTWLPQQTFTGTGGMINSLRSMDGPVGFFRLQCVPSPVIGPALSTVGAVAFSNFVTLSFSEPVDPITAMNPLNYFVGHNSGPIDILGVSQLWSRAVQIELAAPLMPGDNLFLGVQGVADVNGNVITPTTLQFTAVTLQTPCPGGTLLAQQAYSECNTDGFWHVVEDDWYVCPDGTTRKFRVADTKTTQRCGQGQTAPGPAGLLYPMATDVASTCQSPVFTGQIQIRECLAGLWSLSTYLKYRCLDGTIDLSGPVQNVPMNPPTSCNQPPPPMPAP